MLIYAAALAKLKKLTGLSVRWSLFRFAAKVIPDERYICRKYKERFGRPLDLSNPQAFTEKVQWLKLNWRDPLMTICADKVAVRQFVEERIGPEFLKKLIAVYSRPEEIDFAALPQAFALKVNNGSNQMVLSRNKSTLDQKYIKRLLRFHLKNNNYYHYREWSYKNISPLILCEEHLTPDGQLLYDYNFYCYYGEPRFVEVVEYDGKNKKVNTFDLDGNLIERIYGRARSLTLPWIKPPEFPVMVEIAAKLSQDFPFVRVDLIVVDNKIYFGEMTFYPLAGMTKMKPDSFDYYLGSFLKLPEKPYSAT